MVRVVADSRHVSVHEILSPPPVRVRRYSPRWGRTMPCIDFDPYDGWSWRELIVWASDAARVQSQNEQRERARRYGDEIDAINGALS